MIKGLGFGGYGLPGEQANSLATVISDEIDVFLSKNGHAAVTVNIWAGCQAILIEYLEELHESLKREIENIVLKKSLPKDYRMHMLN